MDQEDLDQLSERGKELFSKALKARRISIDTIIIWATRLVCISSNLQLIENLQNKVEKKGTSENVYALNVLMYYLFLIEGAFTYYVDLFIYLLILVEHHDIWDDRGQSFISEFEDLSRISLFNKLEFLSFHDLDLFTDVSSRKIRNAVAHNQFIIHENGNVQLINRKGNLAEIITKEDFLEIYKNLFLFIENMPFSRLIDDMKQEKELDKYIKEF